MSICQVMIGDFLHKWGRYDPDTGEERYDDADLEQGIIYAKGLMEMGKKSCPFHRYDLKNFVQWAENNLEVT